MVHGRIHELGGHAGQDVVVWLQDADPLPAGSGDAVVHGGSVARVLAMRDDHDAGVACKTLDNLAAVVSRAIVYADDLDIAVAALRKERPECPLEGVGGVVDGDHERKLRVEVLVVHIAYAAVKLTCLVYLLGG